MAIGSAPSRVSSTRVYNPTTVTRYALAGLSELVSVPPEASVATNDVVPAGASPMNVVTGPGRSVYAGIRENDMPCSTANAACRGSAPIPLSAYGIWRLRSTKRGTFFAAGP
jgi:hypothetical protein